MRLSKNDLRIVAHLSQSESPCMRSRVAPLLPLAALAMQALRSQLSGPRALCLVLATAGLRFAIREGGRTVGAGVVAKILA